MIIDSIKIKISNIKFKKTVIFSKKRVQLHVLNAILKDTRTIHKKEYCPTKKSTTGHTYTQNVKILKIKHIWWYTIVLPFKILK